MVVRRHYGFPNNDALSYGHGICDKVGRGEGYGQVMGDLKRDVTPSDEFGLITSSHMQSLALP